MRTVVELMGTTVRLLTESSRPVYRYMTTCIHYTRKHLPCTSSSTGSLSDIDNTGGSIREILMANVAEQVILVVSSIEVTVSLSVDMRIFCVLFTNAFVILTTSPSSICCPLVCQVKVLATAVQLNSATSLTETLTARGGMVIPAMRYNSVFTTDNHRVFILTNSTKSIIIILCGLPI